MILTLLNIVVLLGKAEYESANEKCKLIYLTLPFGFCKEKTDERLPESEADRNRMREYRVSIPYSLYLKYE
jgi:hypothetical protein